MTIKKKRSKRLKRSKIYKKSKRSKRLKRSKIYKKSKRSKRLKRYKRKSRMKKITNYRTPPLDGGDNSRHCIDLSLECDDNSFYISENRNGDNDDIICVRPECMEEHFKKDVELFKYGDPKLDLEGSTISMGKIFSLSEELAGLINEKWKGEGVEHGESDTCKVYKDVQEESYEEWIKQHRPAGYGGCPMVAPLGAAYSGSYGVLKIYRYKYKNNHFDIIIKELKKNDGTQDIRQEDDEYKIVEELKKGIKLNHIKELNHIVPAFTILDRGKKYIIMPKMTNYSGYFTNIFPSFKEEERIDNFNILSNDLELIQKELNDNMMVYTDFKIENILIKYNKKERKPKFILGDIGSLCIVNSENVHETDAVRPCTYKLPCINHQKGIINKDTSLILLESPTELKTYDKITVHAGKEVTVHTQYPAEGAIETNTNPGDFWLVNYAEGDTIHNGYIDKRDINIEVKGMQKGQGKYVFCDFIRHDYENIYLRKVTLKHGIGIVKLGYLQNQFIKIEGPNYIISSKIRDYLLHCSYGRVEHMEKERSLRSLSNINQKHHPSLVESAEDAIDELVEIVDEDDGFVCVAKIVKVNWELEEEGLRVTCDVTSPYEIKKDSPLETYPMERIRDISVIGIVDLIENYYKEVVKGMDTDTFIESVDSIIGDIYSPLIYPSNDGGWEMLLTDKGDNDYINKLKEAYKKGVKKGSYHGWKGITEVEGQLKKEKEEERRGESLSRRQSLRSRGRSLRSRGQSLRSRGRSLRSRGQSLRSRGRGRSQSLRSRGRSRSQSLRSQSRGQSRGRSLRSQSQSHGRLITNT
mgnify:CR=1 FL=1